MNLAECDEYECGVWKRGEGEGIDCRGGGDIDGGLLGSGFGGGE